MVIPMNILEQPNTIYWKNDTMYIIPIVIRSSVKESKISTDRVENGDMMSGILYDGCDDNNDIFTA